MLTLGVLRDQKAGLGVNSRGQGLPRGRGDAWRARARPVDVGRPGTVVGRHHLVRYRQRRTLEVPAVRSVVCQWRDGEKKGRKRREGEEEQKMEN